MSFFGATYFGAGGGSVVGGGTIIDSSGSIPTTVGSTKAIDIICNQTITNLTLLFVVETMRGVDVATVSNGSITKGGTTATLSLTSAMTTVERTLRWSLVNTANGEAVAAGLMFITYDAQGDT
jgi:hypothetical protein